MYDDSPEFGRQHFNFGGQVGDIDLVGAPDLGHKQIVLKRLVVGMANNSNTAGLGWQLTDGTDVIFGPFTVEFPNGTFSKDLTLRVTAGKKLRMDIISITGVGAQYSTYGEYEIRG